MHPTSYYPLHFSDATISDLFELAAPYDKNKSSNWNNLGLIYVNIHGETSRNSLLVKPAAKVIKFVKEKMFMVNDPNIYFQFVYRNDGNVLITAQYNSIIGSRWLNILAAADVNKWIENNLNK